MSEKEFNDFINKVIPFINVPKGQIDKTNENVIEFVSFYKKLTGKIIGEGSCKDCILDALFELKTLTPNQLKNLLMEKTYKLKPSNNGGQRLVGFGGDHYNNGNITDEIAFKMVEAKRSNAANFENQEQLLADYDKSVSVPVNPVVVKEKKEATKATDPAEGASDIKVTVKVTEKEPEKKKQGRPSKK